MTLTHYCGTERFERVRRDRLYVDLYQSAPDRSGLSKLGEFCIGCILGVGLLMVVL